MAEVVRINLPEDYKLNVWKRTGFTRETVNFASQMQFAKCVIRL